jgi:hypothetical protein
MTDLARILERELAGACSLNALACRKWDAAETKLAAASQAYECAMAIHGTVMEERDRLATELAAAKAEASHYMAVAQKATDELIFFRADSLKAHRMTCAAGLERDSLRAEVERLTTKIGNQADRIRYLEGATNHATGNGTAERTRSSTPLSQAIALTEKAEDIIRSLRRISNIPIGSDAATNPAMTGTP